MLTACRRLRGILFLTMITFGSTLAVPTASGVEIDGFTEPSRDIDVAAAETGRLIGLSVAEGDRVTAGQVLAKMDDQVLMRSLEIARVSMEASGRLEAAEAELRMHRESLEKLKGLLARSHASQREIDRAQAQADMAQARLRVAHEDLAVKALEFERTRAQLDMRYVIAPIDGVVTQVFKDESEFISANKPEIVKLVQLDPLLIVFSVPRSQISQLAIDQTIPVQVDKQPQPIDGTIRFISPVADAQSCTVRVRVSIPNPGERIPGGVTCRLLLNEVAVDPQNAQ